MSVWKSANGPYEIGFGTYTPMVILPMASYRASSTNFSYE